MLEGVVLNDVSFRRGGLPILDAQSFNVPQGAGLAISGANGVGKSTLLHICAGLLAPQQGSVTLNGKPAYRALRSQLVRDGVRCAVVFQHGGLVAQLSALENVKLPLRYHADVLDLDEDTIEDKARTHLKRLGVVSPDLHALPGRLSLGVQKRVAFARAMAMDPHFVFCDDPDAGLDQDNSERIMELLLQCCSDPCVTVLICSNQRGLLRRLGLPVMELVGGRLAPVPEGAAPASARSVGG